MRENNTGTAKFRLDPQNPPQLTPRQARRLRRTPVDTSDLPAQRGAGWTRPGALIPSENKQQITLRLDREVLSFFRGTGKRYQSRINAVLREYMKAHQKSEEDQP